jgi:hypothetical protein
MRGKVFGLQNNVVNIALSVPLAVAGPLTDKLGLGGVLVGMSLVVAAAGVLGMAEYSQSPTGRYLACGLPEDI